MILSLLTAHARVSIPKDQSDSARGVLRVCYLMPENVPLELYPVVSLPSSDLPPILLLVLVAETRSHLCSIRARYAHVTEVFILPPLCLSTPEGFGGIVVSKHSQNIFATSTHLCGSAPSLSSILERGKRCIIVGFRFSWCLWRLF